MGMGTWRPVTLLGIETETDGCTRRIEESAVDLPEVERKSGTTTGSVRASLTTEETTKGIRGRLGRDHRGGRGESVGVTARGIDGSGGVRSRNDRVGSGWQKQNTRRVGQAIAIGIEGAFDDTQGKLANKIIPPSILWFGRIKFISCRCKLATNEEVISHG